MMNVLDLFVKFYYKLHNNCGIPIKLLSLIRYSTRRLANSIIPLWMGRRPVKTSDRNCEVVVSFTSFPARIGNVWQVVECMLRQTIRPYKIILWLSKDQFPQGEGIPESIHIREDDVFEVRLVDGDVRSHKKYLYVSQEYPSSIVLLIDDDIYYPTDMIERMLENYRIGKNLVCQYGTPIVRNDDGSLAPYSTWHEVKKCLGGKDFFFGSGGGVMFRPMDMYRELTNIELALNLCPTADDIWLNAMTRLAGLEIVKVRGISNLVLPILQDNDRNRLSSINVAQGGNDAQLEAVNDYYERMVF